MENKEIISPDGTWKKVDGKWMHVSDIARLKKGNKVKVRKPSKEEIKEATRKAIERRKKEEEERKAEEWRRRR